MMRHIFMMVWNSLLAKYEFLSGDTVWLTQCDWIEFAQGGINSPIGKLVAGLWLGKSWVDLKPGLMPRLSTSVPNSLPAHHPAAHHGCSQESCPPLLGHPSLKGLRELIAMTFPSLWGVQTWIKVDSFFEPGMTSHLEYCKGGAAKSCSFRVGGISR